MSQTCDVVVLLSGTGSNLQALIDSTRTGDSPARIAAVISNRADAYGLQRARDAGIDTRTLDHKAFEGREAFDAALIELIDAFNPKLVVLAGFMRILSADFVRHYAGRLLNIHPSLLPKYKGLHTHQRALEAGDTEHGCSVHFVTEELDGGPLVVQAVARFAAESGAAGPCSGTPDLPDGRTLVCRRSFSPRRARCLTGWKVTRGQRPLDSNLGDFMRRALLFACALLALPFAQAAELQPFSASYTADWKQLPMSGTAERSLTKQANGAWKLSFKASMMIASLTEESTLTLDKDTLLPQSYHFERGGLGKAKKADLDFDWTNKMVTGTDRGDPVKIPLNRGMVDKSTYQLALQHDVAAGKKSMSYQVVDDGEVDTYDFRVLGSEKVDTKAGQIDAIKVERVRDPTQSKRITVLWFAKDWDYLLVRLQQVETDGKEYNIMLLDGTVNGKAVKGS
jgi:formyltetrahydrofolate-dependent phosphoribosylglycinamide formyltransferase